MKFAGNVPVNFRATHRAWPYNYIQLHPITYNYIQLHTITYNYIQFHTITYNYIQFHTITYIHTYKQIHTYIQTNTYIHTNKYIHTYKQIHTYIQTNKYIHTYKQIHTYIHIYIVSPCFSQSITSSIPIFVTPSFTGLPQASYGAGGSGEAFLTETLLWGDFTMNMGDFSWFKHQQWEKSW